MQHGRHARGRTSQLEFEDVITVDLPDDGYVDRSYLRAVFRDPHNYLPTRSRRSHRSNNILNERESILARRAKQSGLFTAIVALVCAVVTAAAMAEHPNRNNTAAANQNRTVEDITALGAFTATSSDKPSHTRSSATRSQSEPSREEVTKRTTRDRGDSPDEQHGAHSQQHRGPAGQHHDTTTTDDADTSGETDESTKMSNGSGTTERAGNPSSERTSRQSEGIQTVQEFYDRAVDSPEDAAALLVPNLLGEGLEMLSTTWDSLTGVHVANVHERADGTVQATLTVHQPDGTQLHLTQLFSFAESGLIGHIQLLSAQRD